MSVFCRAPLQYDSEAVAVKPSLAGSSTVETEVRLTSQHSPAGLRAGVLHKVKRAQRKRFYDPDARMPMAAFPLLAAASRALPYRVVNITARELADLIKQREAFNEVSARGVCCSCASWPRFAVCLALRLPGLLS